MKRKRTYELLAELFARVPSLVYKLVQPFGVNEKTIVKWSRPVSSDENPYGWGNGNPMDRTEKLIREAHVYDPEKSRELAEYFPSLVDELDYLQGLNEADETDNACAAIAAVVEKAARLIKFSVKFCHDPAKLNEALAQTVQLKSEVAKLEGCLRGLSQSNETKLNAN